MSAFEFILILISVVAGFAVSEILAGWGRVIRERAPLRDIGVHLIASVWLLGMIVRYVWVLWAYREIEWQFVAFVLAFLPILVLALAAYVTNPARATSFDPATHYMGQARPFCYLAGLFLLSWSFGTLRLVEWEDATGLSNVIPIFLAAVFVGLGHVRRPMVHGVMFTIFLLVVIYMSTIAITNLSVS